MTRYSCQKCGCLVYKGFRGYCNKCYRRAKQANDFEWHLNDLCHAIDDNYDTKDPAIPYSHEWFEEGEEEKESFVTFF